jgi:hypothetical protein
MYNDCGLGVHGEVGGAALETLNKKLVAAGD